MSELLPSNYLSNTTFNEQILMDTLIQIKKSSYSYIEEVQRDLVGYHKFDFKFSDFKLDRSSKTTFTTIKRYVLNVPKQLLPTSNKESYKKSELFMMELSIRQIAENYKLFPYSFLVFIDGAIYTNIKIIIGEDLSRVVLYVNGKDITDGIEPDLYNELNEKNADVTVFFIPNSLYGNYATNKYVVKKYNNELPAERFNLCGDSAGKTLSYSLFSSTNTGAMSLISTQTDTTETISIAEGYDSYLDSSFVNLGIITFKHFDTIIDIPVGGDYFELPIREHIVPTTSLMAFYEEDGVVKFYHDLQVKYHYPNIYHVVNNTKPLQLHVFYYKPLDDTHFVNELELYYRFFGDSILQKYKNGTIPSSISNYKPKEYPVSMRLFEKSAYNQCPIDYKTDVMHRNIKTESKSLTRYLKNMMKNRRKIRIYIKNVDLDAKLRKDVSQELPDLDVTFKEDRYVFIFSKYFVYDFEMRFFIDGLFYFCDQKFHDEDYYYFYIPASLIKEDTIIEVEKYRSLQYDFDAVFTDSDTIDMFIDENPCIASDVMFIDKQGNILKEDLFHFIINEDGREIEIEATSHKPLTDRFKLKLVEPAYMNTPMTVLFRRLSAVYEYTVKDPEDANKVMLFKTDVSRNSGHIRIFRNGRLLPTDVYDIRFKTNINNYNVITLNRKKLVGDVYHVEFNPDIIYTNYYTPEINTDGMLDFGGKLNKPFDLKWFDVFLNGYKLDERNFDVLTPRYALIKNVSSKDHLLIMEKNWTEDIFKFDVDSFIIDACTDDDILSTDNGLRSEVDTLRQQIRVDDTIPELLPELIEDLSDELTRLMGSVIRNILNIDTFINPDVNKYRYDLPLEIDKLLNEHGSILKVFPEVVPNLTTHLVFNPDKNQLFDPGTIDEEDGVILN